MPRAESRVSRERAEPARGRTACASSAAFGEAVYRAFRDAAGLRPTPDRVRETLFNWLGQRLSGLACVDLFAGSGALGFEAKSRGLPASCSSSATARCASSSGASARELGAGEGIEVVHADAIAWLAGRGERYDVAFVDPPYASGLAVPALVALEHRLKPGARVYVEAPTALDAPSPHGRGCARARRAP